MAISNCLLSATLEIPSEFLPLVCTCGIYCQIHATTHSRDRYLQAGNNYTKKQMDINISYYLAEHGWSTCWINMNDKTYEMSITHIFHEDPIEECMNCLIRMISGQKISEFKWYGEPGGERITLKEIATEKHMVKFTIDQFTNDCGEVIGDFEESLKFTISKKMLVTMFYFEFKKISELLKDKDYNKNRNSDFPFQSFKVFEKKVLEYLK